MNRKAFNLPVKIYWDNSPSQGARHVKDVLPAATYISPGKIINSSEVIAEGKPWLKSEKVIKEKVKKSSAKKLMEKNGGKNYQIKSMGKNTIKSNENKEEYLKPGSASLRDLRKEDKQKVANLIKELAKFGEEKENALGMLSKAKEEFSVRLDKLEAEKRKAIRKQDALKEKVLEFEIQLKESTQRNRCDSSALDPDGLDLLPGNIKTLRTSHKKMLDPDFNVENDALNEVFMRQQVKFAEQQQLLQQQIEQLQKLQDSIIKQQKDPSLVSFSISDSNDLPNQNFAINEHSLSESIGKNSIRLNDYILSSGQKPLNSIKSTEVLSIMHDAVVEPEISQSIARSVNNNVIAVASKTDSTIQTDSVVQTEVICSDKSIESDRLEQCEKSISLLEQSLNYVSSLTNQLQSGALSNKLQGNALNNKLQGGALSSQLQGSASKSVLCDNGKLPCKRASVSNEDRHFRKRTDGITSKPKCKPQSEELHFTSKSYAKKPPFKSSSYKQSNSKDLILDLFNVPSDSEEDPTISPLSRSSIKPLSAVKRRHFQPSSIVDLADGLMPRSTSTSVDQYSIRKSSKPFKVSQKNEAYLNEKKTLKSIYGSHNNTRKNEICFEDEIEEQNVLDDVFFIRK